MIKGISKQVVLVKPQAEAAFEQAIFIVKDSAAGISEKELLQQAGLAAEGRDIEKQKSHRLTSVLSFLAGAGFVGLPWILTILFG